MTGDYSRGAAGFWIENGKLTYPVSEVTIAGHLFDMFRTLDAGQRSRVPLRHQCADRARGGPDRCRPLTPIARASASGWPRRCARPARSRCKMFRGRLQSWTKGDDLAGLRSRHRGRRSAARAACRRHARRTAGCRRRPRTIRARLDARRVWIVDPIDGTRAFIAGRADWSISAALVEDGRPVLAALFAPATDELFLAIAGGGATLQRRADQGRAPARALDGARVAGPKRRLERLAAIAPRMAVAAAHPLAGAAARAGRATARSMPPSPAATATTGTLRRPIFWCTKPAALLTALDGEPLDLQSARSGARRAGRGRTRPPRGHARVLCASAGVEFA